MMQLMLDPNTIIFHYYKRKYNQPVWDDLAYRDSLNA